MKVWYFNMENKCASDINMTLTAENRELAIQKVKEWILDNTIRMEEEQSLKSCTYEYAFNTGEYELYEVKDNFLKARFIYTGR